MNRGYAAGRARWPLEFGFLNSDCLWVFDEIQIMDTGLRAVYSSTPGVEASDCGVAVQLCAGWSKPETFQGRRCAKC